MPTDNPPSAPSLGSLADTATGRDLDALVAEHVFDWRRVPVPVDANGENAGETLLPPGVKLEEYEAVLPKVGNIRLTAFCRPWSQSLANAEEVLERMRARGVSYTLGSSMVGPLPLEHFCYFGSSSIRRADWAVKASTMPEAICRAAVKEVEDQRAHEAKQVNSDLSREGGK